MQLVKWIARNKVYKLSHYNDNGNAVLIDGKGWVRTVKIKTFNQKYVFLDGVQQAIENDSNDFFCPKCGSVLLVAIDKIDFCANCDYVKK